MLRSELVERKFAEACLACGGVVKIFDPCPTCSGTGYSRLRCRSCFTWKSAGEFLRGGRLVRRCSQCRHQERGARDPIPGTGPLLVKWSSVSRNRKTGPMPVSMTSPRTCPPGCPWRRGGCYGEDYFAAVHWRRLDGGRGMSWTDFCARVAVLPAGQPWRHNEAGDLPGDGDDIDEKLLIELAAAARHTRGFTYTHKPVLGDGQVAGANRRVLREVRIFWSSRPGLVVNLSGDGLQHADQLCDLQLGPVVVTLPEHSQRVLSTPAGRRVVVCPALHDEGSCCLTCMLCAQTDRDFLVGFPAHGIRRRQVSERLVQMKLFGS